MKRIMTGLLALALACTALTGCAATQIVTGKEETITSQRTVITRVAALKGPTAMGIVKMLEDDKAAESPRYDAALYTAADEIVPLIAKNEVDIALIPTNLAATLYQKTEGSVQVIDVNAGNVLYLVSYDDAMTAVTDLRGKTLYMTGKGTTPEWTLRYLLGKAGLSEDELTIEFKAEAAEVLSALQQDQTAAAVLPQPFATVAMMQDQELALNFSLDDIWLQYSETGVATGVTVVRRAFAQEHPEAIARFLADHAQSVAQAADDPQAVAALIEQYGIVNAGVAQQVLTYFNPLTAVSGEPMQQWVAAYLAALYEMSPEAVGGTLPDEGFYYLG